MAIDASMRRPAAVALSIYAALIMVIGFAPTPVDRGSIPLIRSVLAALHRAGVPGWFDYRFIEFSANVALFVPFGILAALAAGRRHVWLAVLGGVGVSLTIELGQWLLLPERFPSGLDVLANTIGTLIGAALGYTVLALNRGVSAARSGPRRSLRGSTLRRATRR
jgi:VanZ family protein